jgi:hypothetical protein
MNGRDISDSALELARCKVGHKASSTLLHAYPAEQIYNLFLQRRSIENNGLVYFVENMYL